MSEPNKVNINASAGGNSTRGKTIRQVTFDKVSDWIKKQGYDEEITTKLTKIAAKFPEGSYEMFRKNFKNYLEQVMKKER